MNIGEIFDELSKGETVVTMEDFVTFHSLKAIEANHLEKGSIDIQVHNGLITVRPTEVFKQQQGYYKNVVGSLGFITSINNGAVAVTIFNPQRDLYVPGKSNNN